MEVTEGYVADVALTGVRLDPGRVGRMDSGEVFEKNVVDVVDSIVTKATYTGCARLVTGYIFNVDVGRVALDRYTVLW